MPKLPPNSNFVTKNLASEVAQKLTYNISDLEGLVFGATDHELASTVKLHTADGSLVNGQLF
jgi:hypothetical protein